ncbi:MAG: cytochrome c/FTR1 family iron permease [Sphingomonas sp.]|nr:cytochrome c/FTR1 family iron permease [Sphingomonas sp.]
MVAPANAAAAAVQTTWRLLDYIAVDYPEAVEDGRIVNPGEYEEMREFSATVAARLRELPAHAARDALIAESGRLRAAIEGRRPPAEIAALARGLGDRLIAAFPVPLAPTAAPDLTLGATLFARDCASCHGPNGDAAVPMAATLDPPPIDFTDRARARERSLFALYQVIGQGLEGTAMTSFAHLSPEERWALAFHSGCYAYPESLVAAGRGLWDGDAALRARIPDLETLVRLTPAALAAEIGEERAAAIMAYLRANPAAVTAPASGAGQLEQARILLRQSVEVYRSGDPVRARELALAAYLDGFEPLEALLAARDSGLVARIEREMGALRAAISGNAAAADVEARADALQALFGEAEAAIAPENASAAATFLGAFTILLREGLEALLVVVAMITFLIRAERRDRLPFVHAGWVAALAAGIATWWAASRFITISGAGRELTEGFGALLAAAILVSVGIWMHSKAQAGAWQAYVRDRLDNALGRGSAIFLFGLAFLVVYREAFETILFFITLGAQGQGGALIGGVAAAIFVLALIAWAMLRLGRKLPIATFFAFSAILIAVLGVVLAGKGMGALQEAGLVGVTLLPGVPRIDLIGLSPTLETLAAQLVTIALLAIGFVRARRSVSAT